MADRTLADVSNTDISNGKAVVKDLLRTGQPSLDTREGTGIASLVVEPAAQLEAYNKLNVDDVKNSMSFKTISDNPELATDAILDALASNYNIPRRQGLVATGLVKVTLSNTQEYTVAEGYAFALDTREYRTLQAWRIVNTVTDATLQLGIRYDATSTPYVIVPVAAADAGLAYNIPENTALTITYVGFPTAVTAATYSAVGGGTDTETTSEFISRMAYAMSTATLTSAAGISATLVSEFQQVRAVSVVGMGDPAMLRDKHNVFGVAMGGRIDAYVKTYYAPTTLVVLKTAVKVADGVYAFTLTPSDAPGFTLIRSVTSAYSTLTYEGDGMVPPAGSLPFTDTRKAYGVSGTWHDFDTSADGSVIETAYSMWQAADVVVSSVPPVVTGGVAAFPDTLELKVEVYAPYQLSEIQSFVDSDTRSNKESDLVVRAAVPAFVTMNFELYRRASASVDLPSVVTAVANYVNGKTFGDELTVSQLASVLHTFDIVRVSTDTFDLQATIRAADGSVITIKNASLDIGDVASPETLVARNTTLFVCDPRNIFITERLL